MCIDCYRNYGSPKVFNENVTQAVWLIKELYGCEMGGAGGYAHIVVDDWNLEDSNVDFCLSSAKGNSDPDYPTETKEAAIKCLEFMQTLSVEERASALAIHDKFINQS